MSESTDISEILVHGTVESHFDSRPQKFVPERSVVDDVINSKSILDNAINRVSILEQMDVDEPIEEEHNLLVDYILRGAKKIFAISISIGLEDAPLRKAMSFFKANGFNDEKLPITHRQLDHLASLEIGVKVRKIWSRVRISQFFDKQWEFSAQIFSTAEFNHDLPQKSILPFTSMKKVAKGSFGGVYKTQIHSAHFVDPQKPGTPCPKFFAVKKLEPENESDSQKVARNWDIEVKALRKMNNLNQDHIVRFITAFRRRGKPDHDDHTSIEHWSEHCLIFEWAEGGSLRDYWKNNPRPSLTASLVKATIKQLLGLAGALERAHNLNNTGASYRHGDLKPENILLFPDGSEIGIFKIGDWGVAKEHNIVTEMRFGSTGAEYGTRRYESPEVETGVRLTFLDQAPKRRSRLYDIWAMGCITLEWIVWLLYGWDGLNTFNQNVKGEVSNHSPFYQLTVKNSKKVARVHDIVVQWLKHMARDPVCQVGTTALGDLLEVVQRDLLVVKLPRRMGSTLGITDSQQPFTIPTSTPLNPDETFSPEPPSPLEQSTRSIPPIPSIDITPAAEAPAAAPEPIRIPVQQEPESEGPARVLSDEFRQRLDFIYCEDVDEVDNYWFTAKSPLPAPVDPDGSSLRSSAQDGSEYYTTERTRSGRSSRDGLSSTKGLVVPDQEKVDYAHPNLDNKWEFDVDNDFASSLFSSFRKSGSFEVAQPLKLSRLCRECLDMKERLWKPAFSVTYDLPGLRIRSVRKECDLCVLLWNTCERHGGTKYPTVQLEKNKFSKFSLTMNGGEHSVLSIFRALVDSKIPTDNSIPIGFAKLPEAGEHTHLEVIRQWLNNCDVKHSHSAYQPATQEDKSRDIPTKRLPTRLIDVGKSDDKTVRLWETGPKDIGEWIALSYQWGAPPHFDTNRSNLKKHINGIDFETLPATFKDAVIVTRGLGIRYLWIDSLCIIQGTGGDFNQEARRMEDVYSGAYCVIAASCATGHYSGFLQARNDRDYVTLQNENQTPFYICQAIDDFNAHVSEGALNRRGWVLQEHALARRSIFFTKHQTYWECGDGVRCETMTKMRNNLAALLGDSSFPQIVENAPQGEKILRYQDFYKRYSQLGLSNPYDRPMAIDGLQRRLLRTMKAKGGFGMFDEEGNKGFLRRSLLWHRLEQDSEGRPVANTLSRIKFPADRTISVVPSWSWMAYTGAIDFFKLDFGGFEWEEIRPPWSRSPSNGLQSDRGDSVALTAVVRGFDPDAAVEGEGILVIDSLGGSEQSKTMCVVLGIEKDVPTKKVKCAEDKIHFFLVVTPTGGLDRNGSKRFERVGAGYLPRKCIGPPGDTIVIH
ncbi:hypothetical protein BU16DRAFT_247175 [Lophium mytilinum]|uniref:Protein kinase domain-containing protein n=1 Tax=Lophium mytilinum TaxID=390894 RepID=A0A6A6R6L2_9PEZI|nr:hypothetical protein BU16DRAFT_247175 [Lophium mytilinum]